MTRIPTHRPDMGRRLGILVLGGILAASRPAVLAADGPGESGPTAPPRVPEHITGVFSLRRVSTDTLPEDIFADVAATYGIRVIVVRDEDRRLPLIREPLYVKDMDPDRFMRMFGEAAPGQEARRHPDLPVWILFPRDMEWTWFLEERAHPPLGPGTTEQRLAAAMAGIERVRKMAYDPAKEDDEALRGYFADGTPWIPEMPDPRTDPEPLPASEGPVWHRLAEILHREPWSVLMIDHTRTEQYGPNPPKPEKRTDRPYAHWGVESNPNHFGLTPAGLADAYAASAERRGPFPAYLQTERMPVAYLAEVEREMDRRGLETWPLLVLASRPLLVLTDWAIAQAVNPDRYDTRTGSSGIWILVMNSANPDVRAYLKRRAPRMGSWFVADMRKWADEETFRELEPLLVAAEERLAMEYALRQAWAVAGREGILPASWEAMDIPPEIRADAERRFETIAARRRERVQERSEEDRRSREAEARHRARLADLLGIDLMRPLAHLLPDPEAPRPPAGADPESKPGT